MGRWREGAVGDASSCELRADVCMGEVWLFEL